MVTYRQANSYKIFESSKKHRDEVLASEGLYYESGRRISESYVNRMLNNYKKDAIKNKMPTPVLVYYKKHEEDDG